VPDKKESLFVRLLQVYTNFWHYPDIFPLFGKEFILFQG